MWSKPGGAETLCSERRVAKEMAQLFHKRWQCCSSTANRTNGGHPGPRQVIQELQNDG